DMDGPFAPHRMALTSLLLSVGTITAAVGGMMCFAQQHITRLLAYSTISHMGLMLIGFALLKPAALAGGALYVIGHGLVKSALFIVAGILLHRYATVDELRLHGHARRLHVTAGVWVFAGLGLAGLPPFATFLGEAAIEDAGEKAGQGWVWVVFLVSAVLTAGAVFRVGARVFRGWGTRQKSARGSKEIADKPETTPSRRGVPPQLFGPAAVLAALALAVGVTPGVRGVAQTAATRMADAAGYQAIVLDHASIPVNPPPVEHVFPMSSVLRGVVATGLALALAALSLSRYWRREYIVFKPVRGLISGLQQVHSGHVGDYVALLTLGVAAFGIVLPVLMKLGL